VREREREREREERGEKRGSWKFATDRRIRNGRPLTTKVGVLETLPTTKRNEESAETNLRKGTRDSLATTTTLGY